MQIRPVQVVDAIEAADFRERFYQTNTPVVVKNLAIQWPAYTKWNWDYFKEIAGNQQVGIYNNTKSTAYTPVNTPDDVKTFGEYVDMIRKGPAEWRIFLFNIFEHAPQLVQDFSWPEALMKGFIKRYPMLFAGGVGSITHMHFDIDLSHILHTQFAGRKRVLLFPYQEQHKLYRRPFEVLSLADFSRYYENKGNPDYDLFPALRLARGYEVILEHGDTLFMPAGFWHHMEYLDSGFAMSLRALQPSISGKIKGAWNLLGMRSIDTLMKRTAPEWWFASKKQRIYQNASRVMASEHAA